jgi:hypothetical protein
MGGRHGWSLRFIAWQGEGPHASAIIKGTELERIVGRRRGAEGCRIGVAGSLT